MILRDLFGMNSLVILRENQIDLYFFAYGHMIIEGASALPFDCFQHPCCQDTLSIGG